MGGSDSERVREIERIGAVILCGPTGLILRPMRDAPRDGSLIVPYDKRLNEGAPASWSESFAVACWYQDIGGVSEDADWLGWVAWKDDREMVSLPRSVVEKRLRLWIGLALDT